MQSLVISHISLAVNQHTPARLSFVSRRLDCGDFDLTVFSGADSHTSDEELKLPAFVNQQNITIIILPGT